MLLRRSLSIGIGVLAALLFAPGSASAGGFEFAAHGTRPLGRAGAFAARADDPLALYYNPAMLADLPDSQVLANLHLAFWDACVDRTGTYGSTITQTQGANIFDGPPGSEDAWLSEEMPRVCNSGFPQPVPFILASVRLLPELGLGFGILPPSGIGNGTWGNTGDRRDGTITAADGTLRPSPVRYGLVQQEVLLVHPSIGVGWRPLDWLRVGLTLQWGVAIVDFVNFTNAGVPAGPEDPFSDIRTELNVVDWFVPAGILSVHIQPHQNLDIMLGARISDAIGGATEASGTLNLTTSYFSNDPVWTPTTTKLDGVTLRAGQPWIFQFGIRYADRIRPRAWERGFEAAVRGVVDDSMYSENFDLELDVQYELNSQVGDFVVRLPTGASVVAGGTNVPVPAVQAIPHGWKDVVGIRLGGDWNIIPVTFAVRAGVHTEIPVAQSRYQIQDFFFDTRVGLHVGATLRIERWDISIAYAHIFQLDTVITDGNNRAVSANGAEGQCEGDPVYDPDRPVGTRDCYPQGYGAVFNNGVYTAEFNVLSLGASYHFE